MKRSTIGTLVLAAMIPVALALLAWASAGPLPAPEPCGGTEELGPGAGGKVYVCPPCDGDCDKLTFDKPGMLAHVYAENGNSKTVVDLVNGTPVTPPAATISLSAPGTVQEASIGAGVTVTETATVTGGALNNGAALGTMTAEDAAAIAGAGAAGAGGVVPAWTKARVVARLRLTCDTSG